MKQVAVTIKIDDELKADVQKLAKNMGLSFSAIVENKLRQVARERRVVFVEELEPTAEFAQELDEALEDIKNGRNLSTAMSAKQAIEHLHKVTAKHS